MRILTVIAGVLLTILGAFSFLSISTYSFAALAFPIGIGMCAAGIFIVAAFIASGRFRRISDAVLVEGIVMTLCGFVVLNDQVKDAMLPIFFGLLLVISGASRIAQCFDVSRYRPRDWLKPMVFAIPATVLGLVMMMPSAISMDKPLMLVGASFIINGFSILIYAMFMEARSSEERSAELKARAAAKQQQAEEKRRRRNEMRKMSHEEKARVKTEERMQKKLDAEKKRLEKMKAKEDARKSRQPATTHTISFTKEESEEIKAAAKELGFEDEKPETAAENTETAAPEAPEVQPAEQEEASAPAYEEASIWPSFKKPEAIPSVRKKKDAAGEAKTEEKQEPQHSAIKLDEIEEKTPEIQFNTPDLPDVELSAHGGEAWKRDDILKELDREIELSETFTDYEALKLEDLISEELPKANLNDPMDKSFTQRLTISWAPEPEFDESIEAKNE